MESIDSTLFYRSSEFNLRLARTGTAMEPLLECIDDAKAPFKIYWTVSVPGTEFTVGTLFQDLGKQLRRRRWRYTGVYSFENRGVDGKHVRLFLSLNRRVWLPLLAGGELLHTKHLDSDDVADYMSRNS